MGNQRIDADGDGMKGQAHAMEDGADEALQIAVGYMAAKSYSHGPCIAVNRRFPDSWEVELAHGGQDGRSETTDPPSIVLIIDVVSGSVRTDVEEFYNRQNKLFPTT